MSGVIVLVVLGLWAGFGWWLWKWFVRNRLASPWVRGATFLALAGAWFVLPVADEILGARAFERLCAEIPETKFHGPIAVGPGAFFDENGNRKWKNGDEFARIQIGTPDWNRLWESRTEETRIARWPIIVFQARSLYLERRAGRVVIETYFRGSGGGWLSRHVGGGQFGGYQCHSKGLFPKDEDTIRFDRNATIDVGSAR
jgi:hypothetical protein